MSDDDGFYVSMSDSDELSAAAADVAKSDNGARQKKKEKKRAREPEEDSGELFDSSEEEEDDEDDDDLAIEVSSVGEDDEEDEEDEEDERFVESILAWRWEGAGEEEEMSGSQRERKWLQRPEGGGDKELCIKFEGQSHLHCEWLPESHVKRLLRQRSTASLNKLKNFWATDPEPLAPGHLAFPDDYTLCEAVLDENKHRALCKWGGLDWGRITWEQKSEMAGDPAFDAALEALRTKKVQPRRKARPTGGIVNKFQALKASEFGLAVDPFPHQVEGINWLLFKWLQGQNVILADEMGLGKTYQSVGVLAQLSRLFGRRRYLVIAPLSTLSNWKREVERFMPNMRAVILSGDEQARKNCYEYCIKPGAFDVLVTSFVTAVQNVRMVSGEWDAVVFDEGHRLKNSSSLTTQRLIGIKAEWRVILTGTPVQNNAEELLNLLSFLDVPNVNVEAMAQRYTLDALRDTKLLTELHELVRPRMLRRVKEDIDLGIPAKVEVVVPVPLTEIQKTQYKHILGHNFAYLARADSTYRRQKPLVNLYAQLRKTVQHPYLFPEAEVRGDDIPRDVEYGRLIAASGKLSLLDRMLPRLKAQGHRVLIFSQYIMVLDILEDYLDYKGWVHERIDGSTPASQRQKGIDRFNAPNSDSFCFLLSTKATRLGINLASADTVIIHDADYNPQNDLQALSRAHRMGQTKRVAVYTLVAKDTVEERLLEIARSKRVLEHMVVETIEEQIDAPALESILMESSKRLFDSDAPAEAPPTDAEVDVLCDRDSMVPVEDQEEQRSEEKQEEEDGPASKKFEFKFARVWEARGGDADAEAPAVTNAEAASFWQELLKDEQERLEEEQRREAERYGKGKRVRVPRFDDKEKAWGHIPEELLLGANDVFEEQSDSSEDIDSADLVPERQRGAGAGRPPKGELNRSIAGSHGMPQIDVELTAAEEDFVRWFNLQHSGQLGWTKGHLAMVFRQLPESVSSRSFWPLWTPKDLDAARARSELTEAQWSVLPLDEREKYLLPEERKSYDHESKIRMPVELEAALKEYKGKALAGKTAYELFEEWITSKEPRLVSFYSVNELWSALSRADRIKMRWSSLPWKPIRPRTAAVIWKSQQPKGSKKPSAADYDKLPAENKVGWGKLEEAEKRRFELESKYGMPKPIIKMKREMIKQKVESEKKEKKAAASKTTKKAKKEEVSEVIVIDDEEPPQKQESKKAVPVPAATEVIVLDDSDEEDAPPEAVNESSSAPVADLEQAKAGIALLDGVSRRAFKYFVDETIGKITMDNPKLTKDQRMAVVWDMYSSLDEKRNVYLERSKRHFEKREKKKANEKRKEKAESKKRKADDGEWKCTRCYYEVESCRSACPSCGMKK